MGQYYRVINTTKKEFLEPDTFGDGSKLGEFGMSSYGTMTALAGLLANSNGRGGGDYQDNAMWGRWANDNIVIAGDYAEAGDAGEEAPLPVPTGDEINLYDQCDNLPFVDISKSVLAALNEDNFFKKEFKKATK